MHYKFQRLKHRDGWDFTGWARTWNGKVVEASNAMSRFINGPVEDLIAWADSREIKWLVKEHH